MHDFLIVLKVITAYYIALWIVFGLCWMLTGVIIKKSKYNINKEI